MARRAPRLPLLGLSLALVAALACSRGPEIEDSGLGEVPGQGEALRAEGLDQALRDELITWAIADGLRESGSDAELRAEVIMRLRQAGPAGLDALITDYRRVAHRPAAEDAAWRALIDAVAQQRDAAYGGLFWHRDLDQARARAAREGKPILSLRLLGDLSSEYSCANSRLFRTVLYADSQLATWLESHFVLHWSSERPVPKVAIDFGDGRTVTRTITGNSAHFVLDAEGRTLDVIPGLWSVDTFEAALVESLELHAKLAEIRSDKRWRRALAAHHEERFDEAAARLDAELGRLRGRDQDLAALRTYLGGQPSPTPRGRGRRAKGAERRAALAAVPMAIGKSKMERPILAAAPRQLGGVGVEPTEEPSGPGIREVELLPLGERLAGTVELHANTQAIIAREQPLDHLVPEEERPRALGRLRAALVASIQQDTAKNALDLYPRVHAELAARAREARPLDFESVDRWLYADLFDTPASDPWLGLIDPAIYTGLEGGGIGGAGAAP